MSDRVYEQIRQALLEALAEVRAKGIKCYGPFNLTVEPIKIDSMLSTKHNQRLM